MYSDNGIIELNVGGQRITTSRATLTAVPESKLALMFTENGTNEMKAVDKNGAVFFDYKPEHFIYLLNQLRRMKRLPKKPPYEIEYLNPFFGDENKDFSQMIIDFGLNSA